MIIMIGELLLLRQTKGSYSFTLDGIYDSGRWSYDKLREQYAVYTTLIYLIHILLPNNNTMGYVPAIMYNVASGVQNHGRSFYNIRKL